MTDPIKGLGVWSYAPTDNIGFVLQVIAVNQVGWAAVPDRHVALTLDTTAEVMMGLGGIGTQTLNLITQAANEFLGGPNTGADAAPTFRKIEAIDLPSHLHTGVGEGGLLGNLPLSGYIEFTETTAPGAGAANTGRLYVVDNGAGKSQLAIIFASGAAQVIATEP